MKKEDTELLKQLLRRFIDDVEKGKKAGEAGWVEVKPRVEYLLQELGLYERGAQGVRVSLRNPLPDDLLKTEEGDLFSDMQRAIKVRELIPRIASDRFLQIGAELSGFAYMLESSEFPVLSPRLFQGGFFSLDEWRICASSAVWFLTSLAAKKVWDAKDIEETLEPLRRSSLPAFEPKEQGEEKDVDKVRKVLGWDKVLEIIDQNACKIMGFLWYVDHLMVLEGIRYPESMVLVQERAWNILEGKTGKPIQELRNAVIGEVERVEEGALDQGFAIASWHEIMRVPW